MKVLLRADAGPEQGTGHVMRCLTLAEGLVSRGHSVQLMGSISGVTWLESYIDASGITVRPCAPDALDLDTVVGLDPDWVVVDSYSINAQLISQLNTHVKCLAIIDGDARGIDASLYLDQNVGSDERPWPTDVRARLLAGHEYCLVRDDVIDQRDRDRERSERPTVVAFMGGTDPSRAILPVARSLAQSTLEFNLTLICPAELKTSASEAVSHRPNVSVLGPTLNLPELLGSADVVVSAAGTSAWDICTMGIPAVLVAVVDNQSDSLHQAVSRGVTLGLNAIGDHDELKTIRKLVDRLILDHDLRRELSARCLSLFDGQGKLRVVEAMEHKLGRIADITES